MGPFLIEFDDETKFYLSTVILLFGALEFWSD